MTSVIGDFLERVDFNSYEDFYKNFKLTYNDDYNFGFDVVDKYAEIDPEKIALIWTNDNDENHTFTFKEMKEYSNKTANLFKSLGIKKGDAVMLTLKNRYEFWFCMVALHKIGAIAIPGTHMLKLHDIDFRLEQANVKMVVSVEEDSLLPNFSTTYNWKLDAATGDGEEFTEIKEKELSGNTTVTIKNTTKITKTGVDIDTTAAKTALLSLFAFAMMCVLGFSLKRRYASRR